LTIIYDHLIDKNLKKEWSSGCRSAVQ